MTIEERLDYYMKLSYNVLLSRLGDEDGGGWLAEIKELRGCKSDGETPDEAIRNLEDAKEEWLTTALEEGLEISEPTTNQDKYSGRLTLRIPKSLHARLATRADKEGVSLNQWILHLLSSGDAPSFETAHAQTSYVILGAHGEVSDFQSPDWSYALGSSTWLKVEESLTAEENLSVLVKSPNRLAQRLEEPHKQLWRSTR